MITQYWYTFAGICDFRFRKILMSKNWSPKIDPKSEPTSSGYPSIIMKLMSTDNVIPVWD
jgi:hypothetical protein